MSPSQIGQRPAVDSNTIDRALRALVERRDASPPQQRALAYAQGRYARGVDRYLEAIASIGFEGRENVLDVGCGVGQWSIALATRNERVTGLDLRPEYVELATTIAGELGIGDAVTFRTGEAERLGDDPDSADAVLSHMVMMWVPEPELGVAELARVLKPSGRAYIAYTTEAMLLRSIASAAEVGWERARVPAVNLVSNALYALGVPRFMGSRVRAYRRGQLEELAGLFGLETLATPDIDDGPRVWRGHHTSGDFLARKIADPGAAADRLVRSPADGETIDRVQSLIATGAPRLALDVLDRAELRADPLALSARIEAKLKIGEHGSAASLLDGVHGERGASLKALYHLQREEPTPALAALAEAGGEPARDFLTGCAHLAAGEPDLALAAFQRELAASPGLARAVGGAVVAALDEDKPELVGRIVEEIPEGQQTAPEPEVRRTLSPDRTQPGIEELAETSEPLRLDDVGLADPDRMPYQVTNRSLVPLVFDKLELGPDDVFIDFGCGKGRVLLAAAARPLKRVIGLDISDELCAVARANIEHNREQLRCSDVQVITTDATAFTVPDDVTVAYMYNPFKGEVFRQVMQNLVASLDRNPRKVTLIYLLPSMDALVQETGRFTVRTRESFGEGELQQVVVYESREPATSPPQRADGPTRAKDAPSRSERRQAGSDDVPTYTVSVSEKELKRADPRTRATFLHVARRMEATGFLGRDARPPKAWALIDLDDYSGSEAFLKACRKVHSGNAVRDARKAAERGYYSKFFDPETFVADLAEVDTSAPERQGGAMATHYMRTVEERGGFPESRHEETPPDQALVWDRFFGVFRPAPGHRQGPVIVDEQLLSYIKLRRAGAFSFYGLILGHSEHLREGVMYKMHLDLIAHLFNNRDLLAQGQPGADESLRGIRYVGYAAYFSVSEGLSMWKRRMLFGPGYLVMRYPDFS